MRDFFHRNFYPENAFSRKTNFRKYPDISELANG